jgi:hypothetical protein
MGGLKISKKIIENPYPHHPLNHSTSQIFPSFSGKTPDLPQVATSPNLAVKKAIRK